jgi:hypothetical protein
MLTRSELPENPVVLAVQDEDGRKCTVTTERVRGGRIRMLCTCDANRASGWCRHQVRLLCMRYDGVLEHSETDEFYFEDVVMGTALADLADEVDVALEEYEAALDRIDIRRPAGTESSALRAVAELAADLADAATHLDATLIRFRKRLATGAAS